jgi:hypothetical protein
METSEVRKRIKDSLERARKAAGERRARNTDASAAYTVFLQNAAVPVFQQAAGALKAEGYPFVVNTPAGSVRLVSEHSSHDFIDLRLDTTGGRPQVLIRVERMKGRETTSEERALTPGVEVAALTEQDVLDAIAEGIVALIER